MHVLFIVEEHDGEERKETWQPRDDGPGVNAGLDSVERNGSAQEREMGDDHGRMLGLNLPIQRRLLSFRLADKFVDRLTLKPAGDEEIAHGHAEEMPIGVPPGDRRVASFVHQLVVIQVVSGDPRERWIPIKNRDPHPEQLVLLLRFEGRAMVVVVCNDAARQGEITTDPPQKRNEVGVQVLNCHHARCEDHGPKESSEVR